jgi:hypothetical protein
LNSKSIAYWVTTGLLTFCIGSGGIAELMRLKPTVEGLVLLGYPFYFVTIIGFWKVLGTAAILWPRLPPIKEWAYAGIFFNMTGAAVSHTAVGDYGVYSFHVLINIFLAILVTAS